MILIFINYVWLYKMKKKVCKNMHQNVKCILSGWRNLGDFFPSILYLQHCANFFTSITKHLGKELFLLENIKGHKQPWSVFGKGGEGVG